MNSRDFTTTIMLDQTPEAVFNAINNVRGWWSEEIEGNTVKVDDVFDYHFQDVHRCRIKLTEVIPEKKVVWLVLSNYFKFAKDQAEWPGTKIIFELSELTGKTQVEFTHQGLIPEHECFTICSNAWTQYIQQSLMSLITTGNGMPNGKDKPATDDEKRLGTE
ncbi:MAG: SRPBCC domain-containing protein [Bacteroidia bacterium]